jgi:hypothetical protein
MKMEMTNSFLLMINALALLLVLPSQVYANSEFKYDESKSLVDNVLDNCASSPSWVTSLKSLIQMSPSKEKCDEAMVALYQFCYKSVGFVEGLANAFGRTIEPGSLAANLKDKCSDQRILNYDYPESFQNIINERNLNEKLLNNK